jgi:hypothetical protein
MVELLRLVVENVCRRWREMRDRRRLLGEELVVTVRYDVEDDSAIARTRAIWRR